ncbi:MAG TPA: ATP-binding protein, partial [Thermoanaerobaculia bacterium]|nr:ATP-binding protein [Thermoanaerobaculia bacterium]
NVSLTRDYAPDFPRVSVFAGELNQVWTNLLDNAIDAVAPGGHVTVRTFRENSHAVVEIEDDGPGIPPEIRDRIWEPFFTTKPMGEGVGLGLDTVRRIVVRRHGGEIAVASVPGETRFTVRLPV